MPAPLRLVLYPDPILKKRAAPVAQVDEALRARVREMFAILYEEKGVGLAAPQVGWSVRLFVVNTRGAGEPATEKVYINPEISLPEGPIEEIQEEEGCLSIPGVRGKVTRHRRLRIKALDAHGTPFEEEVSDLESRVVQHELDHLDGILFITRLGLAERMLAGKTLKKLEKELKERQRAGR